LISLVFFELFGCRHIWHSAIQTVGITSLMVFVLSQLLALRYFRRMCVSNCWLTMTTLQCPPLLFLHCALMCAAFVNHATQTKEEQQPVQAQRKETESCFQV
jgi:hypothetical protein